MKRKRKEKELKSRKLKRCRTWRRTPTCTLHPPHHLYAGNPTDPWAQEPRRPPRQCPRSHAIKWLLVPAVCITHPVYAEENASLLTTPWGSWSGGSPASATALHRRLRRRHLRRGRSAARRTRGCRWGTCRCTWAAARRARRSGSWCAPSCWGRRRSRTSSAAPRRSTGTATKARCASPAPSTSSAARSRPCPWPATRRASRIHRRRNEALSAR